MMRRAGKIALGLVLLTVVALGALLNEWRWFEQTLFGFKEDRYAERYAERALWLPDYQVTIEARAIEGLDSDVSALTFDPERKTLFSVTNQKPELVEISLGGQLLRRVKLEGFKDPEAVEYVGPNQYVISDERSQRLVKVKLTEDTQSVHADQGQQLSLGIGLNGNKGFEGLAYDAKGHRLFVGKERDPIRIYEVQGFPHRLNDGPFAVHVLDNPERDERLFIRDLSSLDYDADTGHLLVLSDESRLILEVNAKGKPISALELKKGQHGLTESVPQAEGLATDAEGNIYVVSEPNLFYKFSKTTAP